MQKQPVAKDAVGRLSFHRPFASKSCGIVLAPFLCYLAMALGILVPVARAQNGVWTNQADSNWSAGLNWKNGVIASGVGNTADFASVTWTNVHTTTLDAPFTVGTIKFGDLANAKSQYFVGANTLTLQTSTGNPTINASNQTVTIGVPLSSGQSVLLSGNFIAITNQNNSFSSGLTLQAAQDAFLGQAALGSGTVILGSSAGSAQTGFDVVATNAIGTLPIVLANNFTVQTVRWIFGQNGVGFNQQPCVIQGNVALNGSSGGSPNDIYVYNASAPLTIGGVVSGGSTYGLNVGNGTLTLTNANNSYTGNLNFTGGSTVGVNSDGAFGTGVNKIQFKVSGATLRIDAPFTTSRSFTMASTGTINVQTNVFEIDSSFGTAMSGAGGLNVSGTSPGQLILTGGNTFTGPVTVNSGATLNLYGGGSLATASLSVATNAVAAISDSFSVPNLSAYTVNNGGRLILSNSPSLLSTANFTLNGNNSALDASALLSTLTLGGTLSGSGVVTGAIVTASGSTIVPGTVGTAGTLTFNSNLTINSGTVLQFDVSTNVVEGGGTNDEIVVGGNLHAGGAIQLNYLNGSLSAGTYKLIKYTGSLSGSVSLLGSYQNVSIDNGVGTPGYITLVVSAATTVRNLIWKGDGVANIWDVGTTANWVTNLSSGGTFTYNDPSQVTFNDFGSNNIPVILNSTVYPASVTFNVTNKAYTLTGSGNVSGTESLTINGGNNVTNGLANSYSGGTVINNGSKLIMLDGAVAGSGSISFATNTIGQVVANNSSALLIPNTMGYFGAGTSTPQFVQNGSGVTTLTGSSDNTFLGATVNSGTLVLAKSSSGSVHALGSITPTLINQGGTLRLGGTGGDQIGATNTVNLAGGVFDMAGLNEQFNTVSGYGSIINGGTLTITNILLSSSGTLGVTNTAVSLNGIGQTSGGVENSGSFVLEGGSLNVPVNFWFGRGGSGLQNILLDGTVTTAGNGECIFGEANCGSLTTFGPNANCTFYYLSVNSIVGVTNYYDGGIINLRLFNYRGNNTGVPVAHYLNGTTFNASGTTTSFMVNGNGTMVKYYVSTNGFVLNDNGFNLTCAAPLLHDQSLGLTADGGLTKSGTGTLTLTATNTFNGPLTVNNGSIIFNNLSSFQNVILGGGVTEQINIVAQGRSITNNSLSLGTNGAGPTTLNFNLGTLGIPSTPILQVNNTVTNSGTVSVVITAPSLAPGVIPLFKYGSMNSANFSSSWSVVPIPYVSITLTNDTVNNVVSALVVPGVTPKWKGNVSAAWDTTTLNWTSNGIAAQYVEPTPPGEPVTFDDTAVSFTVDISTATVNPLFINMSNSLGYTITGSQGIGGTGALFKSGSGALVLTNAVNTYSGVTIVDGGSIVASVANVLSPNSDMTLNNSELNIGSNAQVIGNYTFNNSQLLGNGTLSGASLTLNNTNNNTLPPLTGGLALTINGAATITTTNGDTYSGHTAVNAGTLRMTDPGALGVGGYSDGTRTDVASGGALMFDGANGTCPEYVHLNGSGPTGAGVLIVTNGSVTMSDHIFVDSASTINVGSGASLTSTLQFYLLAPLTKIGGGLLYFNTATGQGLNANEGTTVVSNSIQGNVVVNSGAVFGGTGSIAQNLTVNAGGTLAPGVMGIATMAVTGNFTNSGEILLQVSYNGSITNADRLNVTNTLVYGGTLVVTNVGPNPLVAGNTFKLFNAPSYNAGAFSSISLPALSSGLGWTNRLGIDGTVAVITAQTVSQTPFSIGTSYNNGQLALSWPLDHTGWRLQVQTNSLNAGLGTNWFDVSGATSTNQLVMPINVANGTVFYRMVYP
jgi:fibronectin-binding autotransporter adhesin